MIRDSDLFGLLSPSLYEYLHHRIPDFYLGHTDHKSRVFFLQLCIVLVTAGTWTKQNNASYRSGRTTHVLRSRRDVCSRVVDCCHANCQNEFMRDDRTSGNPRSLTNVEYKDDAMCVLAAACTWCILYVKLLCLFVHLTVISCSYTNTCRVSEVSAKLVVGFGAGSDRAQSSVATWPA